MFRGVDRESNRSAPTVRRFVANLVVCAVDGAATLRVAIRICRAGFVAIKTLDCSTNAASPFATFAVESAKVLPGGGQRGPARNHRLDWAPGPRDTSQLAGICGKLRRNLNDCDTYAMFAPPPP